jgi:hypothetical protein
MCHADPSIVTWDWLPDYRRPFPNFAINHECVKWDVLDAWASERSFSLFDQKSLVHPELGMYITLFLFIDISIKTSKVSYFQWSMAPLRPLLLVLICILCGQRNITSS